MRKHHFRTAIGPAVLIAACFLAGCGSATSTPVAETQTSVTGPSPTATSASTPNGSSTSLPPMKRFRMGGDVYGPVDDCRVDGTAVTCTASWDNPYQADTYAGRFTGTLTGLTMEGTWSTQQTGHDETDPNCRWQMETSAPITYTFSPDGTVSNRQEPGTWRMTHSGSCSGTDSGTSSAGEGSPVRWTVVE